MGSVPVAEDYRFGLLMTARTLHEERLGSVGDIRFVWQKEASLQDWLIIGGDNLFDQDLSVFMDFAVSKSSCRDHWCL